MNRRGSGERGSGERGGGKRGGVVEVEGSGGKGRAPPLYETLVYKLVTHAA